MTETRAETIINDRQIREMDLEKHLPAELAEIYNLDKKMPAIAKDDSLLSVINQTLRSLPTRHN